MKSHESTDWSTEKYPLEPSARAVDPARLTMYLKLLVISAVLSFASIAIAEEPPAPAPEVKPGECRYLAQGVKECYPQGHLGIGRFTIKAWQGVTTIIQLPEATQTVIVPPAQLFHAPEQREDESVMPLTPLTNKLPPSVSAVLRTAHYTITFEFELASSAKDADSQVHVVPFDQRDKDAEVERRVAARLAQLEAGFDARVARASRRRVLDALSTQLEVGSAEADPVRHDHLIIKPGRRVYLGTELYVAVSIQTAQGTFVIGRLVLELERGKTRRRIPSDSKCDRVRLAPRQKTTCWISAAQLGRELAADERLRVTVHAKDGKRTATSRPIDVR